jgi:hypothetical protein
MAFMKSSSLPQQAGQVNRAALGAQELLGEQVADTARGRDKSMRGGIAFITSAT